MPYWVAEAALRWRCAGFVERIAIFLRERSASFTASASGKVSRRSGAIRTTFVPCCIWLKCLPRTPLLKSRVGRGARGSGSAAFFILFSLGYSSSAGPDKTDARGGFSVNDEENSPFRRHSYSNKTVFFNRMLIVRQRRCEGIIKYCHCLSERDSMFSKIACRLG